MEQAFKRWGLVASIIAGIQNAQASGKIDAPLSVIRSVGLEGRGNIEASQAWRELVRSGAEDLPGILNSMDGASDLAANWLRAAIETIVDRELQAERKLPVAELKRFLLDTQHHPRARRLAFDLVARVDPGAGDRLLAGMVNDPSPELRRDAVQKVIQQAKQSLVDGDKPRALQLFGQSLSLARDVDQIDDVAAQLRSLGQTVDLPKVFGFIMQWKVIGPFDNAGRKGFATVYPPEDRIDFETQYEGKTGPVRWKEFTSADERGVISMNKPIGALKDAAAYAVAEFYSDSARPVELRLGSENGWKVWLNGKFLFGQNEYHRNKAMDQYHLGGQLQAGRNVILVKVCQNEQTEDWAGDWDFQLRVCDPSGTPIEPATTQAPAGSQKSE